MRHLILLGCILFTGCSLGHVVDRAFARWVERDETVQISMEDAATGWWHWLPKIWQDVRDPDGMKRKYLGVQERPQPSRW